MASKEQVGELFYLITGKDELTGQLKKAQKASKMLALGLGALAVTGLAIATKSAFVLNKEMANVLTLIPQ